MSTSAVVNVAAAFALVSGDRGSLPQPTSPARMKTRDYVFSDDHQQCDDTQYCAAGKGCCYNFDAKHWKCGEGIWSNCLMYEDKYCPETAPIICGGVCCGVDGVCRDGGCYARSTSNDDHLSPVNGSAEIGKMQLTSGTTPLGWIPDISHFNDGMARTAHEGLHNMFLEVQANRWHSTAGEANARQCYVIGFPADLGQCTKPFDDGCKGHAPTIIQYGHMTFYNTDPILTPVAEQVLDWCNDDYSQSQTGKGVYSYKETQTTSFTQSQTRKVTDSASSTTTMSENLLVEKGSEELTFAFSTEIDVSSSSTQTSTKEKTWEEDLTTIVGPRSHVTTTCFLSQGTFDSPYDAKVKLHTPIVWACTSAEHDPNYYVWPTDKAYWQSFGIEQRMQDLYGFTQADLDAIFSANIGGNFRSIMGQRIQCTTHTVQLQDGESCPQTRGLLTNTSVLV